MMQKFRTTFFVGLIAMFLGLSPELMAQDFKGLDASPHDIAYYRENKLSPPKIKVLYGRPQKRGRVVFGDLIPYGKVWRVGANEATEITFYQDVLFDGKEVAKGSYTVYAIPERDKWTLILSSKLDTWGAYNYDSKFDVARSTVDVSVAEPLEAFSITFKNKSQKVEMILGWDRIRAKVPIEIK